MTFVSFDASNGAAAEDAASEARELVSLLTPATMVSPRTQALATLYSNDVYAVEKELDLRRTNGALRLKKLRPKHKAIIALHMRGIKTSEIASAVGQTVAWVSTVLNDPLAQEIIKQTDGLLADEFKRLRGLRNDAIRDALQPSQPAKIRLAAAKLHGDMDRDAGGVESAEDVMQKMLAILQVNNVSYIQQNITLSGEGSDSPAGATGATNESDLNFIEGESV